MTRKEPWRSHITLLPYAATLVYLLVLVRFRLDPNLKLSSDGCERSTFGPDPDIDYLGAVLLSQVMRRSGAERIIGEWLKEVGPNPVAQLMIVAWAFPFMIEGSSGFGTPAAIAAPLLVRAWLRRGARGYSHFDYELGASYLWRCRHPMWFGFSQVRLSSSKILSVSEERSWDTVATLFVPLIALRFTVEWA